MIHRIKAVFATGALAALAIPPLAAAGVVCTDDEVQVPLSGEIHDNGLQPGTTLGTVHLKIGDKKMKCGILGHGTIGNDNSINYLHTVVCDDEAVSPLTGDTLHSQISLNSTGYTNAQACPPGYPPGSAVGDFEETAVPIAGTGRGIFAGVDKGSVAIRGSINCLASIDMTFDGLVCLKQ